MRRRRDVVELRDLHAAVAFGIIVGHQVEDVPRGDEEHSVLPLPLRLILTSVAEKSTLPFAAELGRGALRACEERKAILHGGVRMSSLAIFFQSMQRCRWRTFLSEASFKKSKVGCVAISGHQALV